MKDYKAVYMHPATQWKLFIAARLSIKKQLVCDTVVFLEDDPEFPGFMAGTDGSLEEGKFFKKIEKEFPQDKEIIISLKNDEVVTLTVDGFSREFPCSQPVNEAFKYFVWYYENENVKFVPWEAS